jgi:hypothetical protein
MPRLPKGMVAMPKNKAPQRARSAYFLFSDAERKKHQEKADPELARKSMAVASKILSARWKALSPAEKKPFEEAAAKLRQEFQRKRKGEAAAGDEAGESGAGRKGKKMSLPSGWKAVRAASCDVIVFVCPSRKMAQWHPPTADQAVEQKRSVEKLYLDELKVATPNITAKEAKLRWRALSDEDKQKFKDAQAG